MPVKNISVPAAHPVTDTPTNAPTLVIVGSGFCGTALAISLLRTRREPLAITLVGANHPVGRGVAYSTLDDRHLLNVPAKSMSALADSPEHFARWLTDRTQFGPDDYVPRRVYGDYLQDTLEQSRLEAHPGVTLNVLEDEVLGIDTRQRPAPITTASGKQRQADAVVLALGNLPPRQQPGIPPELLAAGVYQSDPWRAAALNGLSPDDDVLILGTGLTMVDLVVTLKGQGHRGTLYALSRRGLLPRGHLTYPVDTAQIDLPHTLAAARPHDLAGLVRQVRRAAKHHTGPWQEVVDSLRALTPTLWRDLSPHDQLRFLRRYRAYWDVHRSRIAPEVAAVIAEALEWGQLQLRRGHVVSIMGDGPGSARVTWRGREQHRESVNVKRIISATGPETDLLYTSHTLLEHLIASGAVQPDATGLGISVAASGQAAGNSVLPLYILGSLRRNDSYEGIAVPELRVQARDLADTLSAVVRR